MAIKKSVKIDTFAYTVLLGTFFLLPIVSVPFLSGLLFGTKTVLLAVGILGSFALWIIARLLDGNFVIPKSKTLLALSGFVFAFFIATLFSHSAHTSFFGDGTEASTFFVVLLAAIACFLSSMFFQNKERLSQLYFSLITSFVVVFVFNIAYLFSGNMPAFLTRFLSGTATVVGSWNDLAIYAGFITILIITTIEFLRVSSKIKTILSALLVCALFLLVLINTGIAWVLTGLFSLALFVYALSSQRAAGAEIKKERVFPIAPFIVVLVSLFMILANSFFGSILAEHFKIQNNEVRPALVTTVIVLKDTLIKSPLVGSGPNRFIHQWMLFKPASLTQTQYNDVYFGEGFNRILTIGITSGILGLLGILSFLYFFMMESFRKRKAHTTEHLFDYSLVTALSLSGYLWLVFFLYTPGIVISILTFIMTGITIATLVAKKEIKENSFTFLNDPRKSFFSISCIVLIFVVATSLIYFSVKKYVASVYFTNALTEKAFTNNQTEPDILKALLISEEEVYYRSLTQLYLQKIDVLVVAGQTTVNQNDIISFLQNAEASAQRAIQLNDSEYRNWASLVTVYAKAITLGAKDAYTNMAQTYDKALSLNPHSSDLPFFRAQIEFQAGNIDAAYQILTTNPNINRNDQQVQSFVKYLKK